MAEVLLTGLLTSKRLPEIVASCNFCQQALFLAEQPPSIFMSKREQQQAQPRFSSLQEHSSWAEYASGRIFQEDRELRWTRQGSDLRLIYLGSEEPARSLQAHNLHINELLFGLKKRARPVSYALFGERLSEEDLQRLGSIAQPGDFASARIPRILHYPVPPGRERYARLVICEYIDVTTGQVALFRFQRLETLEE